MYMQRFSLRARRAVVTGGGRGIGLAAAEALSEAGAKVVIADYDAEVAESGLHYLRSKGHEAASIILDVTDPDAVDAAAAALNGSGELVDILVCNAGIARSGTPAEEVTDEHWRNVLDVNLNAVFWCCRSFGRYMLQAGRGSIVNVGSMSGFIVNKPQPQSYYNASKAGVHHLTRSLAAEWTSRGVRVNAVAPTYINTPLNKFVESQPDMYAAWIGGTPMGRMGEPDEVASVILFLASDAASLLTGSIVLADGGYSCW
jgi:NAD(P)-dependent dehydrogenase (short-subunit alcohol dehydrogenase family)